MRRREFLISLGGTAATWPLAARAQQAKLPTIGYLGASTPSNWSHWTAAFVQRLRELGWTEGRTIAIEYRWAEGRSERFAEFAAEFVRLKVDVILTVGSAVPAAKQATATIPIVFALAADPVGSGLVASACAAGRQRHRPVDPVERSCRQTDRTPARGAPRSPPVGGHRQCRQRPRRAGNRRSTGSSPQAWPRRRRAGNPARRGHRARVRDAQERCAGALCMSRSPGQRQPRAHQHLGARRAAADHAPFPRLSRSGRPHVLWSEQRGPVPPRRRLCRQDFARDEAGRPPGRAADQVRSRRQSDDGQGARPHHPASQFCCAPTR